MKHFVEPEIEVIEIQVTDVITTSNGTPGVSENDGGWG